MISKLIFLALIAVAIYTRIQNACECNDDKEIKYDVLQIAIIGIASLYIIHIPELIKFAGIIIVSYIIKNIVKFITKPKITYKHNNECDCKNGFRF